MPGAKAHLRVPAEDPGLLEKIAAVLDAHRPAINPVYAQRCREQASKIKAGLPRLTTTSSIDDLVVHGVSLGLVERLKREGIKTVGALCERDAAQLYDIRGVGYDSIDLLCQVLAPYRMGLRPIPPK